MSDLARARRLFKEFRESTPSKARRVSVSVPKALAVIGTVEFIGYVTTHAGKVTLYVHEFSDGSRPLLSAGKKPGELFLIGKRFRATARGLQDIDARGKLIGRRARRYRITRAD
jgi:hypothetical protein